MKWFTLALTVGLVFFPAKLFSGSGSDESVGSDIRPPIRSFQCIARDVGWEEHRGGHRGLGWTQWEARYRALNHCHRFHGRCYITQCFRVH